LSRIFRPKRLAYFFSALAPLTFAALPLAEMSPEAALWTTPAILLAAMMIAWAAESAQFFIAQGFALAILAWLQTLPEFAVEAVLAWKQQVPLLMANLTGALRLLTGLGWPMIYFVASVAYKRRHGKPMREICLDPNHSLEVAGLAVPLAYIGVINLKGSLTIWDGFVLILIYALYLVALSRLPAEDHEGIEDLDRIPRTIVKQKPWLRTLGIIGLFAGGGLIIYFTAEPFLGSLLALSAAIGVPSFVFVQWVAPFVSEFPEKLSAFYWARTVDKAPMALMNMVSSNINQWTLLTAMLVLVYSWSRGEPSAIVFDRQQSLELSMTLGQSVVGLMFLINMRLAYWEAAMLFGLWFVQFALSGFVNMPGAMGFVATHIHEYTNIAYWVWAGVEFIRILTGVRQRIAIYELRDVFRNHIFPPTKP
jgi:cation:H+ antiporter